MAFDCVGKECVLKFKKENGGMNMSKEPIDFSLEELLVLAEGEQRNVQYAVGFYYENGVKTQVDLEKAAQWYKKAADQGHEEAQLHLGLLYAQG